MAIFQKKASDFATPYTVSNAVSKGNPITKFSMLIMGLGCLAHKQIIKGLIYLAIEVGYIWFMIQSGIGNLQHLITLGGSPQEEVWNEAKGVYEYVNGDMTILFLLYGVGTIFLTIAFIIAWRANLKCA